MKIPAKTSVEVFINTKWYKFIYIGSFELNYGPMGMEYINYIFPKNKDKIESWNEIKDSIQPIDILNHIIQLNNDLSETEAIEIYGEKLYSNFLVLKPEIGKLKSLLFDEMGAFNDNNILWIEKGGAINFDTDFYWSNYNEWARRDPDCIILFEEELEEQNSAFVNEIIYSEVINLLKSIFEKLLKS